MTDQISSPTESTIETVASPIEAGERAAAAAMRTTLHQIDDHALASMTDAREAKGANDGVQKVAKEALRMYLDTVESDARARTTRAAKSEARAYRDALRARIARK